jgi:ribosome biogenesis protein ERB1
MKIVRAIRQGKIVKKPPPKPRAVTAQYDVWSSDPHVPGAIKAPGTQHIPAPKIKLPDHDESYNPPAEYLPSEAEIKEWEELDEEDREKNYLPKKYATLRLVPGWGEFIMERFERCLDLYLAPRVRKQRLNIDPDSLIPKLPSPRDLRPFPTKVGVVYEGHTDRIRATVIDPTGLWVATGSDDGTVRVWEIRTGREVWKWSYPQTGTDEVVYAMGWNPLKEVGVLAVAVGDTTYLLIPPVWSEQKMSDSRETCEKGFHADETNRNEAAGVKWTRGKTDDVALVVKTSTTIRRLTWHGRGDYFSTVAPQGPSPHLRSNNRHKRQSSPNPPTLPPSLPFPFLQQTNLVNPSPCVPPHPAAHLRRLPHHGKTLLAHPPPTNPHSKAQRELHLLTGCAPPRRPLDHRELRQAGLVV